MSSQQAKLEALFATLESTQQMQEMRAKNMVVSLVTPKNYSEAPAELALSVGKMIEEPDRNVVVITDEDDEVHYSENEQTAIGSLKDLLRNKGVTVYDSVEDLHEDLEDHNEDKKDE